MSNEKEYKREWYLKNKEAVKERAKRYKEDNVEHVKEYHKAYREDNKDKLRLWNENNAEHVKEYKRVYKLEHKSQRNSRNQERKKTDPIYYLSNKLRSDIVTAFTQRGYIKSIKTREILGCTFIELKQHLEKQFEPWMNWNNRGNWNGIPKGINLSWDIDHIVPLDSATCIEDIVRLNHYTNLQPLCSYVNRNIKRNKLITSNP